MLWPIFAVAAAIVLASVMHRQRHGMALARVRDELQRARATDIVIRPQWLDFDRDTLTYDVQYTAPDGARRTNRCKVPISPLAEHTVYWADPL